MLMTQRQEAEDRPLTTLHLRRNRQTYNYITFATKKTRQRLPKMDFQAIGVGQLLGSHNLPIP